MVVWSRLYGSVLDLKNKHPSDGDTCQFSMSSQPDKCGFTQAVSGALKRPYLTMGFGLRAYLKLLGKMPGSPEP